MSTLPLATESARPFLSAKDLALSGRSYVQLGFEPVLDAEVAVFRIAASGFVLTPFARIENCMMQLMVDDLNACWAPIEALDLRSPCAVPTPRAPEMQPWG